MAAGGERDAPDAPATESPQAVAPPGAADRPGRAALAALLALFLGLAGLTFQRAGVWSSQLALWTDAAGKSPDKARVHLSLGYALRRQGRYGEAIAEYRRGLATQADADTAQQLRRNLAAALIWAGRNAEAVTVLEAALAERPGDSELLGNLGSAALGLRDPARAAVAARQAVAADETNGAAWNVLGSALLDLGDLGGARDAYLRAAALDPDDGLPSRNLARALDRLGDAAGACQARRRALGGRLLPAFRAEVTSALAACR